MSTRLATAEVPAGAPEAEAAPVVPLDNPAAGTVVEDSAAVGDGAGQPIRYTVSSYGADFTVEGYLTRLARGDLVIPAFQRRFVWSAPQASRFIESVILDLPVPGVFLFREPDTRKLLVVDGQQRLLSLQRFRNGVLRDRPFRLTGVSDDGLNGQTYSDLLDADRRAFEDAIIHATIFQQVYPQDDRSSVVEVFERLNTGATALVDQEVRVCVYRGAFSELLSDLNRSPDWRNLFGNLHSRRKDEEIILRFLALYDDLDRYRRPMKRFLNGFMHRHRHLDAGEGDRFAAVFRNTASVVNRILGRGSLRPKGPLNVAVADAVLVGVARRLDAGPVEDPGGLRTSCAAMMEQLEERELYQGSTTHGDRLRERIGIAVAAFASAT